MRNLVFLRRGELRSPAGCAEVKLNGGCANKLRQALPHGEGAAQGGGRGGKMQDAECRMQNSDFSRRWEQRSLAGCAEVKLNEVCANKSPF